MFLVFFLIAEAIASQAMELECSLTPTGVSVVTSVEASELEMSFLKEDVWHLSQPAF